MRHLPPFQELVAFEAVARLLSFTRAAEELCITQSAVSHRVRRLEQYFGSPLIERLNPGIALTELGGTLLPKVAKALDELAQLDRYDRQRTLRVVAGQALCTWWLAGRLAKFMQEQPSISIELIPVRNDDASTPEADVRILWVSDGEDTASDTQIPLFNEQVFPVCSPRLLPNGPLRDTSAIESLPLLHKLTHVTGEWSWDVWLKNLNVKRSIASNATSDAVLRFADVSLVLSAAVEGSGIALTRSLLAHDALRDKRLVLPMAAITPMRSSKKHVARWRRDNGDNPDVKAFVAWLLRESKLTLAETEKLVGNHLER